MERLCNLYTLFVAHTLGESRGALQLKEYEWKGTADIQPLITNPDPIREQFFLPLVSTTQLPAPVGPLMDTMAAWMGRQSCFFFPTRHMKR